MTTFSLRRAIIALSWCFVGHGSLAVADGPVRHSVYQNAPSPDRYAAPPVATNTQPPPATPYNFVPAASYPSGFTPPPEVMNGMQNAVDDASNSLRRGLESGMQQANQQISSSSNQFFDSARNAGEGVSAQAQEFANSAGRQMGVTNDDIRSMSEPFLRTADVGRTGAATTASGVSEPPWTGSTSGNVVSPPNNNINSWMSAGSPPTGAGVSSAPPFTPGAANVSAPAGPPREQSVLARNQNWSSLGNSTPAPPLLTPSLAPPPTSDLNASTRMAASPPTTPSLFGSPPTNGNTQNANPSVNSTQGPLFPELPNSGTIHSQLNDPGAASAPVSSGSRWDANLGFPPPTNPAASGRDPFNLPPVQGGPAAPGAASAPSVPVNFGSGASQPPSNTSATGAIGANAPTATGNPSLPPIGTSPAAPRVPAATAAQRPSSDGARQAADEVQRPWVPLVLTMLGLIGSVSANFFLGWSYMDARQKYQTLARKTADKFRRAADAA